MALIPAPEFLRSKGYTHGQLSKGPKDILKAINELGIEVEKTVLAARGISLLVDEEKAEAAYSAYISSSNNEKKSDGKNEYRTLIRQDRSLARAILAIANELGIKLHNQETIIDISEYGDK